MPISSLAISLSRDAALADDAARSMEQHPRIEVGRRVGSRLPVVVDTPDREEDKAVWAWINQLPGVAFVDVVFVHFDDQPTPGAGASREPANNPAREEQS